MILLSVSNNRKYYKSKQMNNSYKKSSRAKLSKWETNWVDGRNLHTQTHKTVICKF